MVVCSLQKDHLDEPNAEEIDKVASAPEVISLAAGYRRITREDQAEIEDHNGLEECIHEPSPKDFCAETGVFHPQSVVFRVSD